MQSLLSIGTCLGVVTVSERWTAVGWNGGGVGGRDGKLASFCKVAAVSDKPEKKQISIFNYVINVHKDVHKKQLLYLPCSVPNIFENENTEAQTKTE